MTQRSPWDTSGPSSIGASKGFRAGPTGKTRSQVSSELADQRRAEGSIPQLVIVGRAERLRQQVLADRWGSPFLKPGSAKP